MEISENSDKISDLETQEQLIFSEKIEKTEKKPLFKDKKEFLVVLFSILAVSLVVFSIFYLNFRNKQIAGYLKERNEDFNQSIALINEISSEKRIKYDNDDDLYLRLTEEELSKTEETLKKITELKKKNEAKAPNKNTDKINLLLKNYFDSAEKNLEEYLAYIKYLNQDSNTSAVFYNKMNEAKHQYMRGETVGLAEVYQMVSDFFGKEIDDWNKYVPPAGLEQQNKKNLENVQKTKNILDRLIVALRKGNNKEIEEAAKEWEDFSNSDEFKLGEKAEEEYFSNLHQGFSNLKRQAVNIRGEINKAGMDLGMNLDIFVIDAW